MQFEIENYKRACAGHRESSEYMIIKIYKRNAYFNKKAIDELKIDCDKRISFGIADGEFICFTFDECGRNLWWTGKSHSNIQTTVPKFVSKKLYGKYIIDKTDTENVFILKKYGEKNNAG